jgi:hypothetical protein
MNERENLFRRWSRLKQETKAAEEVDIAAAGSARMAVPEPPFDPANLPSIESISADTDIIAFLRAGVPTELVRSALRRAWTSDPAIRDFVGIAENQWDFNDPNAIPGFGPLTASEDGLDVLAQISSRLQQHGAHEDSATAEPTISSDAPADASDRQLVINNPPLLNMGDAPSEMLAPTKGAGTPTPGETRKKRHGSALPH